MLKTKFQSPWKTHAGSFKTSTYTAGNFARNTERYIEAMPCYRYNTVFSTLYAIEMVTAYPTAQDKPLLGWGRGIKYAKVWRILAPAKILKCSKAVDSSGPQRAYSSPMPRNGTIFSRSFRWPLGKEAKLVYSVTFCGINHFKPPYLSASSKNATVKAVTQPLASSAAGTWCSYWNDLGILTRHHLHLLCHTPHF